MVDLNAATTSLRFPEGNNGSSDTPEDHQLLLGQPTDDILRPLINATYLSSIFAFIRLPENLRSSGQVGTPDAQRTLFGDAGSGIRIGQNGDTLYLTDRRTTIASQFPEDEDAALMVVSSYADEAVGARQIRLDLYSLFDGSLIQGYSQNPRPGAGWDDMFRIGGSGGAEIDDGDPNRFELWNGEIASMGIVTGGTLGLSYYDDDPNSDRFWERIALGEDIQEIFYEIEETMPVSGGAHNYPRLEWYRDFDGTAASLVAPDPLPVPEGHLPAYGPGDPADGPLALNDTSLPTELLLGELRPGTDFVWRDGTRVGLLTVAAPGTPSPERLSPGIVVGIAPGAEARRVEFSGFASGHSDGASVEIRLIYRDSGEVALDWTSMGNVQGEAWSGQADVPLSDQGWLVSQIRVGGSDGLIWNNRDPWGVGYKVVQLGQSQTNIYLGAQDGSTEMAPEHFGSVSVLRGSDDNWSLTLLNPMGETDSLNVFVNQFRTFDPKTPIMIVPEAVNGTGQVAFVTDEDGRRNWSDFQEKLDAFGNDISVVLKNWGTNDMGVAAYDEVLDALIEGTGARAGDHSLDGALQDGWVMAVSPLSRHTSLETPTGLTSYSANASQTRQLEVEYANENGHVVGLPVSDFMIEPGGGPHQTVDGSLVMAERMALTLVQAVGAAEILHPHFTFADFNADRTEITVSVALPNGGVLSSPAPEALRSFRVYEESSGLPLTAGAGGFSARLDGNVVVLSKAEGQWGEETRVDYLSNLEDRNDGDEAEEAAILAGTLYETWDHSVLGLGLPVLGTLEDGQWVPDWSVAVAPYNMAPIFLSTDMLELVEASDSFLHQFELQDEEPDLLQFTLAGEDADQFLFDSTDVSLRFAETPDFSTPQDQDGDNVYRVTLSASDGRKESQQSMSITVLEDSDGDGVANNYDNAIYSANPDQRDSDGDGYGNVIDADLNNDGTIDGLDYSGFAMAFGSADSHADLNGDAIVDGLDFSIFSSLYGTNLEGLSYVDLP